ncbi:unnamed protein product, partial [marine sediment metagenome]
SFSNPHQILIYLLSGALGFSTCENLGYSFKMGEKSSTMGTSSIFENELLVLILRLLLPIHAICAAYQAVGLVEKHFERKEKSLFSILLPSIILHGSFDFVMMLIGVFTFTFNIVNKWVDVVSFAVALLATIITSCHLKKIWKRQQKRINQFLAAMNEDEEEAPEPTI